MKKLFTAALVGFAFVSIGNAQVVITSGNASSTTDLFQNAVTTLTSQTQNLDSNPAGLFGGIGNFNNNISYFENSGSLAVPSFIEFNTISLLSINRITLSLFETSGTPATSLGSASRYTLYGRQTSGTFTNSDIISTSAINPDYAGTYGSAQINITDTFTSKTAQYFRLELTRADGAGVQVIELDGYGVAVPEPSTYLFLGLSALLFVVFKSSTRKKEII